MKERGRIILSWHPRRYHFSPILKTDQLLHGEVIHLPANRKVFLTLEFGGSKTTIVGGSEVNCSFIRRPLVCIKDFNSVLRMGERIGGVDATEGEIRDFATCVTQSGLQESQGLSDHTPIIPSFPQCPKPKASFQFCEMWTKDKGFTDIVKHTLTQQREGSSLKALQHFLIDLRHPLRQLNKNKFADIYKQQATARNDLLKAQAQLQQDPTNQELIFKEVSCRDLYISINHLAMLLIKQQCKAKWISYGDECTRVFIAKIKQRRACTSIYHIKDQDDQRVEGFEAVSKVIINYYKKLLEENDHHRTQIDIQMINMGECLNLEQQMQLCKPFTDADIKKVLFSIPTHKSPGPDGYNSGFYKAC
ncbi:hypothetical protein Cgig2_022522 [Carnegiea gigantea]|uniref:Uncharacterized protein n=1 Tax=Carnegiea gigantea TaxID=171969 RepID=A0A9Q1GJP7_9CARY|nr:hypothetical protein Cgig2_022522 [Carnegiea gigantea]